MPILFSFDFFLKIIKINIGGVAQLVEQENHNLRVRGSSPFAAIFILEKEEKCQYRKQNIFGWTENLFPGKRQKSISFPM